MRPRRHSESKRALLAALFGVSLAFGGCGGIPVVPIVERDGGRTGADAAAKHRADRDQRGGFRQLASARDAFAPRDPAPARKTD